MQYLSKAVMPRIQPSTILYNPFAGALRIVFMRAAFLSKTKSCLKNTVEQTLHLFALPSPAPAYLFQT
jgi:hypothetical protein